MDITRAIMVIPATILARIGAATTIGRIAMGIIDRTTVDGLITGTITGATVIGAKQPVSG
jgi:hypothetical protein